MGASNPAREGKQTANRNSKEGNPRYEHIGRTQDERCPIASASPDLLADAIQSVAAAGDLLSFGSTRDGGAWLVAVYSNGVRYPQYAHSAEELEAVLREIVESCI